MSIFSINENNGFLVIGGQLNIVTGLQAVIINCQHVAQTIKFENPFNIDEGLPNFETVWDGNPNILQYELFLSRALIQVKDVDKLSDFNADISDNVLNYSIKIHTPFGVDTLSGTQNV